jgi:hypothetical protein
MIQDGQVGIYFRYPTKKPEFIALNLDSIPDWKTEESHRNHDTIFLWTKKLPVDSLILQISDNGEIIDTFEIDLMKKKEKDKSAKKEDEKPKRLGIMLNTTGGSLNQFTSDLTFVFSYPLARYDLSSVSLVDEKDTVKPRLVVVDSLKRSIRLIHKWKEDKKYRVIVPDSSFFAINDQTNDSLIFAFRTRSERDFGSLKLTVDFNSGEGPYIIQLLTEKNELVEQRRLDAPGKLVFTYMSARKYKLKAIYDQNKNNRWDTGDYLRKIQPEEVWFFPEIIEIRANWEVEENWSL